MALHDEAAHMQQLLDRLAHAASGVVHRLWQSSGGDPDLLEQHYPAAVTPFISAASGLGAQWYHQQAPELGFAARTLPPPPPDQLADSVRYAFGAPPPAGVSVFSTLSQEHRSPFQDLSQSTDRHVYNGNRDTVTYNANRENVMYARYASSTACAFCRLLATRAPVYSSKGVVTDPKTGTQKLVVIGGRSSSKRKPGTDYHDNCKCLAVPVRPGASYEPPDYVNEWKDQYDAAMSDPDTHTLDEIVNHMRRQQYAADKAAGTLPKRTAKPNTPE